MFEGMRRKFSIWVFRLFITGIFIVGLLVILVVNPALTYARQTRLHNYIVFHNKDLPKEATLRLDEAFDLVKASEIYNAELKLDVCLNDGGTYSALIQRLKKPAFAWGVFHEVIIGSKADFPNNYAELYGYQWNLVQVLAHEMIHCYQFDHLGLLNSNPLANYPEWKWEGYPEYIARRNSDQQNLVFNIDRLQATQKTNHDGWIKFKDSTGTVLSYYEYWLLMQYCLDVKHLSYKQVLQDTSSVKEINQQMMNWYKQQK